MRQQTPGRDYQVQTIPKPREREACLALFIGVLTSGSVTNVVYEVIFATGSPADTIHSFIVDMSRPSSSRSTSR